MMSCSAHSAHSALCSALCSAVLCYILCSLCSISLRSALLCSGLFLCCSAVLCSAALLCYGLFLCCSAVLCYGMLSCCLYCMLSCCLYHMLSCCLYRMMSCCLYRMMSCCYCFGRMDHMMSCGEDVIHVGAAWIIWYLCQCQCQCRCRFRSLILSQSCSVWMLNSGCVIFGLDRAACVLVLGSG